MPGSEQDSPTSDGRTTFAGHTSLVLHSRSLAWDASLAVQLEGLTIDASGPIGSFVDPTAQALRTYGFAILKSVDVAKELLDDRLTKLGSSLGTIVMQSQRGELIEDVRDTSDFDGEVDTRGYRSGGELVPHSDPPTLIVLHCVTPARSGGESYLVNVSSIVRRIAETDRSSLAVLFDPFPMWRVEGQNGRPAGPDAQRLPVLARHNDAISCMVYRPFIEMAAEALGEPLSSAQTNALDRFDACTSEPALSLRFNLNPNQTLLVHNRTVLHARTNYVDWPELNRRRHLRRLWIDAPDLLPVNPAHELGDIFAK